MSLRELASAVGTSTNAIYALFGGKERLIHAVVADARTRFEAQQEALAEREPALDAFAAMGRHYRTFALDNPNLYRLMFHGQVDGGSTLPLFEAGLAPVRSIIRRLIAEGTFRDLDPDATALSGWATLHGFVLLETSLAGDPGFRARADDLFDFHLRGFTAGLLAEDDAGAHILQAVG